MSRALAVFLLALAYFGVMMPWGVFQDPDAFYHAHAALLLWRDGPLLAFPWLDLTTLGASYADHHVLFHAVQAPFVAWLGWATGSRVSSVLLAAGCMATLYACLRWLGLRYAPAWTALTALSQPLATRLMLGKASPLAIALFVLGMAAAWRRAPAVAFAAGVLFALAHGGSIFLLGSVVLLACGEVVYRHVVEDAPWRIAFRAAPWRETLAVAGGIAFGTAAHPNFPENLAFLWVQVVTIGLGTPLDRVVMGNEWLPSGPGAVFGSFAPWFLALLLGLAGLLFAPRDFMKKNLPIGKKVVTGDGKGEGDGERVGDGRRDAMAAAVAFALPVAVLLALTFKSRRIAEYLVPALALWIPWLWQMTDVRMFAVALGQGYSFRMRRVVYAVLALALVATVARGTYGAYDALHTGGYRDDIWQEEMAAVSALADPGDRVFHSDWDEFPVLWNLDDRLRYVAGLDPTFLLVAASTLSDAYRDLTWGRTSSTPDGAWDLIHGRLGARFVFVDLRDHRSLADLLKGDGRYTLLLETGDGVAFEIRP
ncbi:hypothetical protein L0Y59_01635 [Candidatus Uhrbacteria bacterium]|nr:hypothetical protein [Candidatus Uhrbacteria bacterium]